MGRPGGEDMHILRPLYSAVAAAGGVKIMVAGSQEDPAPEAPQGQGQGPGRLAIEPVGVKQISGQKHYIGLMVVGPIHHTAQDIPALLAAEGRLLLRQTRKSAVQVQIRRMQELHAWGWSSCQPLHTSTHSTKLSPQQRSSSSQVSSMAEAALPTAGNTVSNRFSDTSR